MNEASRLLSILIFFLLVVIGAVILIKHLNVSLASSWKMITSER